MKKLIKIIFSILVIAILSSNMNIYADDDNEAIEENILKETEKYEIEETTNAKTKPTINSRRYIVYDRKSGRCVYGKDENKQSAMASTTKIMSSLIVIENCNLKDTVTITEKSAIVGGSKLGLKTDDKITVNDLLYGLMLRSGNDAALAIAHYVGGNVNDFVKLMNKKAKEIGMKNTTFNNPSGLDQEKGNFSTAYDMAILTSYAMKNKIYREVTKTKNYKLKTNLNYYDWTNKNRLLNSYKYATGGKTGFTEKARRTLVTTATKDGVNLVVVTLNDGNDFNDHESLFEEAFQEYKNYSILKKGNINISDEKYYKKNELYIKNNFNYILTDDEKDNIIIKFELEKKYNYKDNDKVGKLIVKLSDEKIYEDDVYIKLKKTKISIWEIILGWFK